MIKFNIVDVDLKKLMFSLILWSVNNLLRHNSIYGICIITYIYNNSFNYKLIIMFILIHRSPVALKQCGKCLVLYNL
jgi:hypothetical protein